MVVSVLGDGSGNSKDEWVSFWADDLAEGHAVSYRAWNSNTGDYGDAERLSQIGTAIEIYNGSRAGETAIEAGASLGDLQPESPDLVVLNLGHSESASEMTEGLDGLWSTISADHEDARGLVILQNPASGDVAEEQDTRIDLLRSWASDNQLPTLDVHRAFNEAPDPLSTYLFDGSYPNESGSRLWADTVTAALSS
ncbi:Lysophospholipase L1 [Auraticoccus monumenti]|uniref:Lysophospholipase L1 n=1 Tax=Auraticoccus monumenti TaxID=675864 RepID=A0A1G6RH90_9ACTN|nr:Lysophospholipase L1 [Auraticoccus monumenti]